MYQFSQKILFHVLIYVRAYRRVLYLATNEFECRFRSKLRSGLTCLYPVMMVRSHRRRVMIDDTYFRAISKNWKGFEAFQLNWGHLSWQDLRWRLVNPCNVYLLTIFQKWRWLQYTHPISCSDDEKTHGEPKNRSMGQKPRVCSIYTILNKDPVRFNNRINSLTYACFRMGYLIFNFSDNHPIFY